MAKVWSNVMLVLPNVIMELSNVRGKKMRITECDKSTVACNLVMPNVTMKLSNVRKKFKYDRM